jgi:hypothetical protein
MQHPMEAAKRLSTVPLISKVLRQTRTFLGRKFRPGSSPALDAALRGEHLVSTENLHTNHTLHKCPSTEFGDSRQACRSAITSIVHSDLDLRHGEKTCFVSPSHIEEERVCGQHNDGSFSTGLSGQSGRLVLLLFPGPGAKDLRHLAEERPAFRELEKTLVVSCATSPAKYHFYLFGVTDSCGFSLLLSHLILQGFPLVIKSFLPPLVRLSFQGFDLGQHLNGLFYTFSQSCTLTIDCSHVIPTVRFFNDWVPHSSGTKTLFRRTYRPGKVQKPHSFHPLFPLSWS